MISKNDLRINNASLNIKKLQSSIKHHMLNSEFNKEKDTLGKMADCKFIDLVEGVPRDVHIIGDEKPIHEDSFMALKKEYEMEENSVTESTHSSMVKSVPILFRLQDCQPNQQYQIHIR